jgi:hypothetical protein
VCQPVLSRTARLGWIAGPMAASDPLLRDWLEHNAPVLMEMLPALCACLVDLVGHPAIVEASLGLLKFLSITIYLLPFYQWFRSAGQSNDPVKHEFRMLYVKFNQGD